MKYPILPITRQIPISINSFPGYDHRLKAAAGAMFECENLSLRRYPMLSPRLPRERIPIDSPQGLAAKDALCFVSGGTLYINQAPTELTGLMAGEKQLVSMGAYILIFPDKLYYNTAAPSDYGSLEACLNLSGSVEYCMCDSEGVELTDILSQEPAEPQNGQLWLSGGELLEYSGQSAMWVRHETVYTRLTLPTMGELPRLFRQYDGVEISGAELSDLNGNKIIYALGGSDSERDYLVLVGLCEQRFTVEDSSLRIERKVPDMDFVCQCQNRLWGCRYGNDGERNVNEIYCSALGDFRNFRQYLGLSTDSWAGSLGSDGPFTGAVSYLDSPCFFKADRIHRVSISPIGAHRVSETVCRGVQKGSHKSLCVVGESLYYKAENEVCVWQGGFPVSVSAALGERHYSEARAGAVGGCYYISMRDDEGGWHLFVYDTRLRLWQREDGLKALCFATKDSELWCIDEEHSELNRLVIASGEAAWQSASPVEWTAQTGIQDFETANRKYLSRLSLNIGMAAGSSIALYLRYDSEGDWHKAGELELKARGTALLPLRPRRCHHFELKIEGRGDATLYSITGMYEEGSDV